MDITTEDKLGLNDYIKLANENAKDKGFYDDYSKLLDTIMESNNSDVGKGKLIEHLDKIEQSKDLALLTCEVAEAIEHLRNGNYADNINWKNTIEEELADIAIRLFNFAGRWEVDLEKWIRTKMRYNANREYKHGKTF